MSIVAGRTPDRPVGPTRRTTAPRKRGDDTRAKIIDETVRCIMEEGFAANQRCAPLFQDFFDILGMYERCPLPAPQIL